MRKRLLFCAVLCMMIMFSAVIYAREVINVPADYATIQAAIDAAADGDEIIVSPGIYYENISIINKTIIIASLFYTTQDTSYISQAVIDGGQAGSVVVFEEDEDVQSLLCGFTIRNGNSINGGGISCQNASPDLANLIITGNIAVGGAPFHKGGGIYGLNSHVNVENVELWDNHATIGGAVSFHNSSPIFYDVSIHDNISDLSGGGINCEDSDLTLENMEIWGNFAHNGGALRFNNSNSTINDVSIHDNVSENAGGGLDIDDSGISFENVMIMHNFARMGGGIFSSYSAISLANVTITGNSAVVEGGGISSDDSACSLTFDAENLCNIYLNNVENRNGGSDVYSFEPVTMIVDTFTVMNPTGFHVSPLENFTFHILHGLQEQINADLYVSPDGDNSNSGLNCDEPLGTIQFACSIIQADADNAHSIFLGTGTYCPSGNGEFFPVMLPSYVSLIGSGEENTILDAEGDGGVLMILNSDEITISDITLLNGLVYHGAGIFCENSDVNMYNISVLNCQAESDGGGINFSGGNLNCLNVTISDNDAQTGGGILIENAESYLDSLIISNNTALYDGGGIYLGSGQHCILNSKIISNTAGTRGGGMEMLSNCVVNMENVDIVYNHALRVRGGGICASGGVELEMAAVTIAHNSAPEKGGGLYLTCYSQPLFSNDNRCNIYLNNVNNRGYGNDIYSGNEVEVILDTFTVLNPTDYHTAPLDNFTFDILTGLQEQVNADLYVSPEGDNTNNGLSENEPLKTIQHACSIIQADSLNPHTIYLLSGTYSPSINGEFLPISLPDNVSLSGTENSEVNLDGEYNYLVLRCYRSHNNTISNLKIINGYNNDGGGIYIKQASPTIQNVTLESNTSETGFGGAIFIGQDSSPLLTGVKVQQNNAAHGGGIFVLEASPTFQNVVIKNNSVSREGGGLNCRYSNVILQDVEISGNWSQQNGAGIMCEGSVLTMNNCLLFENTSLEPGGAIICKENSILFITNSTITDNVATSGSGLFVYNSSSAYLTNCIFWDNFEEEICFNGTNSTDIFCLVYSDIQDDDNGIIYNNYGTVYENEIIDQNPHFMAPQYNDYALQYISPCIDAGVAYFEYDGQVIVDLEEDEFWGIAPDMGACEYVNVDNDISVIENGKINMENYPNPFNPVTNISYEIGESGDVQMKIYNFRGQKVETLVDGYCEAGKHAVIWNADNQSSGIYFIYFESGAMREVKKITLLK